MSPSGPMNSPTKMRRHRHRRPIPCGRFPAGRLPQRRRSVSVRAKGTITRRDSRGDLSASMISYWTEFAKKGDPNSSTQVYWPPYEPTAEKRLSLVPSAVVVETGPEFNSFHMCSSYWDTL